MPPTFPLIPLTEVYSPAAWRGIDLNESILEIPESAALELSKSAEVIGSANGLRKKIIEIENTASDVINACERGVGFARVKISNYDESVHDLSKIFWALSLCIGKPVTQNQRKEIITKVTNIAGNTSDLSNIRAYETNRHLGFHSDASDILGLACVHQAATGGVLSLVSAITVHNDLLSIDRSLLPLLYEGFFYHKSADSSCNIPIFKSPVFYFKDGVLTCRYYLRDYMEHAYEYLGLKQSKLQNIILDTFDAVAAEPSNARNIKLVEGEMIFISNHSILHARSSYKDGSSVEKNRTLLRTWLSPKFRRSLPDWFAPFRDGY